MPPMDADSCKTEGNAAMAEQDYVNAMKWYSQAIALSPRDGALFSNRSFAFLRLGLTSRALADADEAIRRRPDWNKGHFRRAECLKQLDSQFGARVRQLYFRLAIWLVRVEEQLRENRLRARGDA